MSSDTILYDVSPSPELVRRWGYDEHLYFLDQDEDLILHEVRYVPVLLELAGDGRCPKREYALSILYYYSQLTVLHQHHTLAREIENHAELARRNNDPGVRGWGALFQRIFSSLVAPQELDDHSAIQLASDLLAGPYCSRSIERTGRAISGFTEFRAYTDSFQAFLYLHQQRGVWRYSQYESLDHLVA